MNKAQAVEWVRSHNDIDELDEAQLEEAFRALAGRAPDQEDWDACLWSLVCSLVD